MIGVKLGLFLTFYEPLDDRVGFHGVFYVLKTKQHDL